MNCFLMTQNQHSSISPTKVQPRPFIWECFSLDSLLNTEHGGPCRSSPLRIPQQVAMGAGTVALGGHASFQPPNTPPPLIHPVICMKETHETLSEPPRSRPTHQSAHPTLKMLPTPLQFTTQRPSKPHGGPSQCQIRPLLLIWVPDTLAGHRVLGFKLPPQACLRAVVPVSLFQNYSST